MFDNVCFNENLSRRLSSGSMSVALPFTTCVAALIVGVSIGRWFRVGVIALTTLGVVIVTMSCTISGSPVWQCALYATGLSFLLQFGYLVGAALLDVVATRSTDCVHASLGPT